MKLPLVEAALLVEITLGLGQKAKVGGQQLPPHPPGTQLCLSSHLSVHRDRTQSMSS